MITVRYSTVLAHPLTSVWALVRDFNNYPVYIDGVSESIIEDGRRGDEVGAVRRFCYLGHWVRQRLMAHSDDDHRFSYAGLEPLPFPEPERAASARYEGTIHLREVVDGARTFIEWSVTMDAAARDAENWRDLLERWIPDWTDSLTRTLARG